MFNSTFKPSTKSKKLPRCCICKTAEVANKFAKLCTSEDCVITYANKERDKRLRKEAAKIAKEAREDRQDTRKRKEALKSRQEWLKDVETIVNKYVRLRDAHLPCISCDRPSNWQGQWHASHYKSVGSNSALRFHLLNIHKSCSICNDRLSGNLGEYYPRLKLKIGADLVEWLDNHPRSRSYDIEYLKRFKAVFQKKVLRLKKRSSHVDHDYG